MMQVILLENIGSLGGLGDTVDVKPGYGRNFLIPQGKRLLQQKITSLNLKHGEQS